MVEYVLGMQEALGSVEGREGNREPAAWFSGQQCLNPESHIKVEGGEN